MTDFATLKFPKFGIPSVAFWAELLYDTGTLEKSRGEGPEQIHSMQREIIKNERKPVSYGSV